MFPFAQVLKDTAIGGKMWGLKSKWESMNKLLPVILQTSVRKWRTDATNSWGAELK